MLNDILVPGNAKSTKKMGYNFLRLDRFQIWAVNIATHVFVETCK